MGLFSKTESYLGIDIGAHGIKLVELHNVKGRPQLWTYGILDKKFGIHASTETVISSASLDDSNMSGAQIGSVVFDEARVDDYASMLKELLKQSKVTTKRVTASLPVSFVFHSIVTLPIIEEKDRTPIIMAQVSKLVSQPANELQVIYQLLPSQEKNPKFQRFLVTSAPKSIVAFYTAIFQKAGLELAELETGAFAVERSLVGKDVTTTMVVDMGAERTNFFIIDNGLPMTHRSIQIGGDIIETILQNAFGLEDLTGQLMRDVARMPANQIPSEIFTRVLNPIIKEVEYNFDMYLQQTANEGKRPQKIVITGGAGMFPLIEKSLRETFDVKVFIGDPWARVVYPQSLRPTLAAIGPRMAASIGLALRHFGQ
jgi:type IV pilus assembly protein PilM